MPIARSGMQFNLRLTYKRADREDPNGRSIVKTRSCAASMTGGSLFLSRFVNIELEDEGCTIYVTNHGGLRREFRISAQDITIQARTFTGMSRLFGRDHPDFVKYMQIIMQYRGSFSRAHGIHVAQTADETQFTLEAIYAPKRGVRFDSYVITFPGAEPVSA